MDLEVVVFCFGVGVGMILQIIWDGIREHLLKELRREEGQRYDQIK